MTPWCIQKFQKALNDYHINKIYMEYKYMQKVASSVVTGLT